MTLFRVPFGRRQCAPLSTMASFSGGRAALPMAKVPSASDGDTAEQATTQ
ncbi:hypothetical protein D4M24_12255 [Escherichia coli]|nr:hypothetical protein D4M24_12255 [Escherichia coli]